jgi:hypothetical protein
LHLGINCRNRISTAHGETAHSDHPHRSGEAYFACRSETASPKTPVGGGGFQYHNHKEGNCGVSAVGVNDKGKGYIQVQAQLVSSLGRIVDGSVTIIWHGGGKGGHKIWEPKGVDWISPVTHFTVPQHKEITVLVTGHIKLHNGDDCTIENPHVKFSSS